MNDYQPTATYDEGKKHKFKKNSSLGELKKGGQSKGHKTISDEKKTKTMRTSPSRNTITSRTPAGFTAKVAENLEAAARLHHETMMSPPAHRKVYTDVFSAYLTPNSLNFLSK